MNPDDIWKRYWKMLHDDLDDEVLPPEKRPKLAHYTSLTALESILRNEQIWLSNPLNMNDHEEVQFSVNAGMDAVFVNNELREALREEDRREQFYAGFSSSFDKYGSTHAVDLYVACFSSHDPLVDSDGRLSMWRGYGQNGKGVAIVFSIECLEPLDSSPMLFTAVDYKSQNDRKEFIGNLVARVSEFISGHDVPQGYLQGFANALFQRIWLYSIFSKHTGFDEEREWRLAYMADRDEAMRLKSYLSYHNGPDGIATKLKLPLKPIDGVIGGNFRFSDLVHSIIIGPTSSSLIARKAVERMLEAAGKPELIDKVRMSGIPFRG